MKWTKNTILIIHSKIFSKSKHKSWLASLSIWHCALHLTGIYWQFIKYWFVQTFLFEHFEHKLNIKCVYGQQEWKKFNTIIIKFYLNRDFVSKALNHDTIITSWFIFTKYFQKKVYIHYLTIIIHRPVRYMIRRPLLKGLSRKISFFLQKPVSLRWPFTASICFCIHAPIMFVFAPVFACHYYSTSKQLTFFSERRFNNLGCRFYFPTHHDVMIVLFSLFNYSPSIQPPTMSFS